MVTTYDPADARYLDEADLRRDLSAAFDVCASCRRCVDLCGVFPTVFALLEGRDSAGDLTPGEQDRVLAECFGCKLCVVGCPYAPGASDVALDMPRLMQRSTAALADARGDGSRVATAMARVARALPSIVNPVAGAAPGSLARKVFGLVTGASAQRMLAPIAKQRFSTWLRKRAVIRLAGRRRAASVYASCDVEYHVPELGRDLVAVYERNGIECSLSAGRCCGAALLDRGDVALFAKTAAANVAVLAAEARRGLDIVVTQPTCAYVIANDYPLYVPGPDAAMVAEHTFEACEYLLALHTAPDASLDTDFHGDVPEAIRYHVACHTRVGSPGTSGRDLLRLTGAQVTPIAVCSGMGAGWGARRGHEQPSLHQAGRLRQALEGAGDDLRGDGVTVVGACQAANTVIAEQTGRPPPLHPLQVLAKAYGRP